MNDDEPLSKINDDEPLSKMSDDEPLSKMSDDEPLTKKSKNDPELPSSEEDPDINEDASDNESDKASTPLQARKKLTPAFIGRGRPFMAQAREVVYNVFYYMSNEYDKFKLTPFKKYFGPIHKRVIAATGVSQDTVTRILNQVELEGKVTNPHLPKVKKDQRLENDMQFLSRVRDAIIELNFQNETVTLWKLITKLQTGVSKVDLKKILYKMGYVFVKIEERQFVIVESVRARLKRIKFLEGIKTCREEERKLVYISELTVYVVAEEEKDKSTQGQKNLRQQKVQMSYVVILIWNANETTPCDIIVHKFVPKEFDTWLRTDLLLKLPEDAALIVPSSLHPNKFSRGYPLFTASTSTMRDWLAEYKIPFPKNCLKAQLYEIIMKNKTNLPLDNGENFLTDNGYILLQIPKYHWGLNPLEIILPNFLYISGQPGKRLCDMDIDGLLMGKLKELTSQNWEKAVGQTMRTEEIARENDLAMDEISDIFGPCDAEVETEDSSDEEF